MKGHLENVPRLHQGWPVVSPCGPGGSPGGRSGGGGRGVGHICQVGTGRRGAGQGCHWEHQLGSPVVSVHVLPCHSLCKSLIIHKMEIIVAASIPHFVRNVPDVLCKALSVGPGIE